MAGFEVSTEAGGAGASAVERAALAVLVGLIVLSLGSAPGQADHVDPPGPTDAEVDEVLFHRLPDSDDRVGGDSSAVVPASAAHVLEGCFLRKRRTRQLAGTSG
jgi:hypothetical protein